MSRGVVVSPGDLMPEAPDICLPADVTFQISDELPAVRARLEAMVRESVPAARVVGCVRIASRGLWRSFDFHRRERDEESPMASRLAFHQARDPSKIVGNGLGSNMNGFEPRFAQGGTYGTGAYFARHAIYPMAIYPKLHSATGEYGLFVVEVAHGRAYDYGHAMDDTLRMPPVLDAATGQHYDSVQGLENHLGGCICGDDRFGEQYVVYTTYQSYPHWFIRVSVEPSPLLPVPGAVAVVELQPLSFPDLRLACNVDDEGVRVADAALGRAEARDRRRWRLSAVEGKDLWFLESVARPGLYLGMDYFFRVFSTGNHARWERFHIHGDCVHFESHARRGLYLGCLPDGRTYGYSSRGDWETWRAEARDRAADGSPRCILRNAARGLVLSKKRDSDEVRSLRREDVSDDECVWTIVYNDDETASLRIGDRFLSMIPSSQGLSRPFRLDRDKNLEYSWQRLSIRPAFVHQDSVYLSFPVPNGEDVYMDVAGEGTLQPQLGPGHVHRIWSLLPS